MRDKKTKMSEGEGWMEGHRNVSTVTDQLPKCMRRQWNVKNGYGMGSLRGLVGGRP